jgi:hypothetical protein
MKAKMNKYIFTLATLLDSKSRSKKQYSADTVISDLFDENLDEIDFIRSLSELELIYGFEISGELYDRTNLTFEQFAEQLSQLTIIISDEQYPKFYDIKMESMRLTRRYIELETKTDEDSLREKNEINQEFEVLTDHLNVLLGNTLVN